MCVRIALIMIGLWVTQTSMAGSSLFKVHIGEQQLYLGGTIHLLRAQDTPLPKSYWQIYSLADEVMFEADILSLSSFSIQTQLMQRLLLPPQQSLPALLKQSSYQRLQRYLQANQMPENSFDRYSAEGVYMQITTLEMLKAGFNQPGVDRIFAQQAKKDAKPSLFLESIEQQMQLISQLGEPAETLVLNALDQLPNVPKQIDTMMQAWLTGNAQLMNEGVLAPMQQGLPRVYQRLLVQRNQQWIPIIEQQLLDANIEFILVGAAHLYGQHSLPALLREKGYVVEVLE